MTKPLTFNNSHGPKKMPRPKFCKECNDPIEEEYVIIKGRCKRCHWRMKNASRRMPIIFNSGLKI
jgi:hypothetical protein